MFLHPLGLLALLAVPAILALHLFRRRFAPRPVSALFLWAPRDRTPLSGRTRERLRSSASLWLELAAAVCLALALAGPRACSGAEAQHWVVVLDSSASMGALVQGASVRDRAVELVRQRIDGLSPRSRVTLVRSGTRPTMLAGPAAFPQEASERLAAYEPTTLRHDLGPSVALGLQLSGGASVVLVTDQFEPDAWPEQVEIVSLGAAEDNLAFTHAVRTRERSKETGALVERVFLTTASFASRPRHAKLELSSGGKAFEARELDLAPLERRHWSFELPLGSPLVEARLSDDALAIDNRALLAPVPARTLALYSSLGPEEARVLGLASGTEGASSIDRWLALVPDSIDAGNAEAAHLAIASAEIGNPRTWCLTLESAGAERRDLIGPFLLEKRHPALEGLTLEGVVWSMDPEVALTGAPLVAAGNDPLLCEERAGGKLVWRMNFDPARSSLQRSPDWPILLANLAELRRAELPGPERVILAVGESLRFRAGSERTDAAEAERYILEGPEVEPERREILPRETLQVDGLARPGVYTLAFAGRKVAEFAVNFADAGESDLRGLRSGTRAATGLPARFEAETSWVELVLAAMVLALALADTWVLSRASRLALEAGVFRSATGSSP